MTCKGYDSKAVKLGKSVKRIAATILDAHERGAFIRANVAVVKNNLAARSQRVKKEETQ